MEKTIFYGICKDKSVNCTININGKDRAMLQFGSYKQMRSEYKGRGFKFIKCEEEV